MNIALWRCHNYELLYCTTWPHSHEGGSAKPRLTFLIGIAGIRGCILNRHEYWPGVEIGGGFQGWRWLTLAPSNA
jgi:hypothetical protein